MQKHVINFAWPNNEILKSKVAKVVRYFSVLLKSMGYPWHLESIRILT